MTYLTGWKKDRFDERDYLHAIGVAPAPKAVSLKALLPEVRDQGSNKACVGFSIGANLGAVARSLGIFTEWYSPSWIWNGARSIEGTLIYNVGVFPKDALDWLIKSGCLHERFWTFDPESFDMAAPSSERMAQAIKYPDFAYFRVTDGANGMCSALAQSKASMDAGGVGWLISLGTPWFNEWFNAPGGVLTIPRKEDYAGGGHETCIYGYDQDKGVFEGMNSWGTVWGDQGFFTMPFESLNVFKELGGYDAQYITFKNPLVPDPQPPPKPEPTPAPCKFSNAVAKTLNFTYQKLGRHGRFYYMNPPKTGGN